MTFEVRRGEASGFDWASARGDAAAVRLVVAEAAARDGRSPLDEAAELELARRGLDGTSLWVAEDGDDPVGFALMRPEEGRVDLAVAPDHRRRGIGETLLDEVLAETGDRRLTAWSHGNHPAAAALGAQHGFAAARELWVLRRPATLDLPVAQPVKGVSVRPFAAGDEDGLLAVNAAAFADHPEQGALDRSGLDDRMRQPWFDPAGLLVAERDGEVVGFHWTKVHPGGAGEVYVIGTAPALHGTGLGRLLLVRGLEHLREQCREVHLHVEADNARALRLYAGLGFTHDPRDTHVQYVRP